MVLDRDPLGDPVRHARGDHHRVDFQGRPGACERVGMGRQGEFVGLHCRPGSIDYRRGEL